MPARVINNNRGRSRLSQPFVARKLQTCNDVELNPGPGPNKKNGSGSPMKNGSPLKRSMKTSTSGINMNNNGPGDDRDLMPVNDVPRVKKLGKICIL